LPTQSAGVSGKGNIIIPRWRQISDKKGRVSPQWELKQTQAFDIFPAPLISHYPLALKRVKLLVTKFSKIVPIYYILSLPPP
jgi:hypothetical protein